MKYFYASILLVLSLVTNSCKKDKEVKPIPESESSATLNKNTLIISNEPIYSSLVSVDSEKVTFIGNGAGIDKIEIGSILVSDITEKSPNGFLRRVESFSLIDGKKVCVTSLASLTDAMTSGDVKYKAQFTDADIVSIDSSGNSIHSGGRMATSSFKIDFFGEVSGLKVSGDISIEPTLEFELGISDSQVEHFKTDLIVKNVTTINGEVVRLGRSITGSWIIRTYKLKPRTIRIGLLPLVINPWIVFSVDVNGEITAKLVAGIVNTNTLTLGVEYNSGVWKNLNDNKNSLGVLQFDFERKAQFKGSLVTSFELHPYGLKESNIALNAAGSVIAKVVQSEKDPCKLTASLDWGADLSVSAKVKIFDKTMLDYDAVLAEGIYPLVKKEVLSLITKTDSVTNVRSTAATSGGFLKDTIPFCVTPVIQRGVVWSTTPKPSLLTSSTFTSDGVGLGKFTSEMENLETGKTYYTRAYAKTPEDTIYGNEQVFKTGYSVGDTAQGGIVFYVDETKLHGMVYPMPDTLSSFRSVWWPQSYTGFVDAPSDSIIGSGQKNTINIVNKYGSGTYTAKICDDLESGGYSDWYLPSIFELAEILPNKDKLPGIQKSALYRSSTGRANGKNDGPVILRGVTGPGGGWAWLVWGINTQTGRLAFDVILHANGSKNNPEYFIPVRRF